MVESVNFSLNNSVFLALEAGQKRQKDNSNHKTKKTGATAGMSLMSIIEK
jgi:hypothetical protein